MSRDILPGPVAATQVQHGLAPTSSNWNQPRPKRKATNIACETCRTRKRKCNGGRPCTNCQANCQECIYEANEGETSNQALKRKYSEIQQDRDELRQLFSMIASKDPRRSGEIVERIQSGQSASTILKQMQHGDLLLQTTLRSERHARHVFLSNLMQTTASFDDVIKFIATSVVEGRVAQMPNAEMFRQLRGHQTDIDSIRGLLGHTSPRRIAISDLISTEKITNETPKETGRNGKNKRKPPYNVPAKPWTIITDDDDLVSHLISIFLEWYNPFLRFVEEDLFVEAMQSKDLDSLYCSPFLVNSMISFASLASEREEVFIRTDDYMTRGEQFRDEAIRLWYREDGRASLSNLQGLCIMFSNCVLRGKDKQGVNFVAAIFQLNRAVPMTLSRPCSEQQPTAQEAATYKRARRCIAWSVYLCDIITANTALEPAFHTTWSEELPSDLPDLPLVWTGYPTQENTIFFNKNTLFLEICKLNKLGWHVQNLLYSSDRSDPVFHVRVEALIKRIIDWKCSLPESVQYRKTMPGPIYELHAYYYNALISLYSLFQPLREDESQSKSPKKSSSIQLDTVTQMMQDRVASRMRKHAVSCALEIANMLGDFRQTYGLKINMGLVVQANGVACFTLLQELDTPASHAAFKEVFRCLLGTGMQLLWARGMARMLHLTAQNTGIVLPKAINTMLAAVADTAWTKTDMEMLSSRWPNYVIAKEAKSGESVLMEDLIKKWERFHN